MATAASMALPPCRSTAAPTSEATCDAVTTMPWVDSSGGGDTARANGAQAMPAVSARVARSAYRVLIFVVLIVISPTITLPTSHANYARNWLQPGAGSRHCNARSAPGNRISIAMRLHDLAG